MAGRGSSDVGSQRSGRSCANLTFAATIQSVPDSVRKLIKADDELAIRRDPNNRAIVVHAQHGIVGSLIDHVPELLQCIEQGYEYTAKVTSVDASLVRVQVRPR